MTDVVEDTSLAEGRPDRRRRPLHVDRTVGVWLAATSLSLLGDSAWTVALVWTATRLASAAVAGTVLSAELLPQAVLILVGGVLADQHDARKLLLAGQIGRALILGGAFLAWSLNGPNLLVVFAVALTFGAVSGLTTPASTALVRQLAPPEGLSIVNGWSQIGARTARLLGAPLGGVLVAAGGLGLPMVADAATFAVNAAALALVVRPRFPRPPVTDQGWRPALTAGVSYLRRHPTARSFVLGLTALNVFVSPVVALGVALRVGHSGWGAHWLGISDGALAAGAILGSLLALRVRPARSTAAGFAALVVQGTALAAVGIGHRSVLLPAMAVVGVTAGAGSTWLSSAFLRLIDPNQVGRVASVTGLGDLSLGPASLPAFGALAALTGLLTATTTFGLTMSAMCLVLVTRPAIRHLRS